MKNFTEYFKINEDLEKDIEPFGEEDWEELEPYEAELSKFENSKEVDIYGYTKKFLEFAGFYQWETILLIPRKYFSKLKEDTELGVIADRGPGIDEKTLIVGKDKFSMDARGGYLAYGVMIEKLKK